MTNGASNTGSTELKATGSGSGESTDSAVGDPDEATTATTETTISKLDRSVVERIAAGEVVTRPASVVTELVENSLDAGASTVTVRIAEGGKSEITVADDGCGMSVRDAALAVERHTTSKIREAEDVGRVATLGFRGEALSSIARMGRLTLTTKTGGVRGTEVIVAEDETDVSVAGRDVGTTVTVRDLFYNTPARRKSLASTKREFAAISEAVTDYALCRPNVRFRLEHNGREVLTTPGSGRYTDAVLGTYGRTVASRSTEIAANDRRTDAGSKSGKGGADGGSDEGGTDGVDGNSSNDRTTDGRAADGSDVAVAGLLAYPSVTRASAAHVHTAVNGRAVGNETIRDAVLAGYGSLLPGDRYPVCVIDVSLPPTMVDVNVHPAKAEIAVHDPERVGAAVERAVRDALGGADLSRVADLDFDLGSSLEPVSGASVFETSEVIGRFRDAYVLCETNDDLLVIDQHAAHERINYERLVDAIAESDVASAPVDPPEAVALSPPEVATIDAERERIEALGFAVETVGGGMCRVARVPAPFGEVAEPGSIRDVLASLSGTGGGRGEGGQSDDPREEALKALACHPSIAAGDDLTDERASELLDRLGACEQPFACPHGRPTVLSIDERAFVRGFERPNRRLG